MINLGSNKVVLMIIMIVLSVAISFPAIADDLMASQNISWSLADNQGKTHHFPATAKANQQTTLILFWATWCPYCKQLMPHIQSALHQYGDALNLKVYAMNINEDKDPEAYLRAQGYSFKLFPEAEAVAKKYQVHGTPAVLIFDPSGTRVFDLRSVNTDHLVLKKASHGAKSLRLAPYWAAEIRMALDRL